jgi:hypothetical protein
MASPYKFEVHRSASAPCCCEAIWPIPPTATTAAPHCGTPALKPSPETGILYCHLTKRLSSSQSCRCSALPYHNLSTAREHRAKRQVYARKIQPGWAPQAYVHQRRATLPGQASAYANAIRRQISVQWCQPVVCVIVGPGHDRGFKVIS